MGRLALVPLAAGALLAGAGILAHERTQDRRMDAVAVAVQASGHAGPVQVEPLPGDECWRAREGFAWRTADAQGRACAGPGSEVQLEPGAPRDRR